MDRVKAEDSLEPAKATGTWSCRVAVKPIHWILCKRWQQGWNGWFYLFIYFCSNFYHFAMPPFSTSHKLSNCPSVAIAPRTLQSKMRGRADAKKCSSEKIGVGWWKWHPFPGHRVQLYGCLEHCQNWEVLRRLASGPTAQHNAFRFT